MATKAAVKFKYVGQANETAKHDAITAYGLRFEHGKAVEVTDPAAITKLQGNSHFEQVSGDKSADFGPNDPRGAVA